MARGRKGGTRLRRKFKLNPYGIIECEPDGTYKASVPDALERSLGLYEKIRDNQGEMITAAGQDGKTRYFRLRRRRRTS